MSQLIIMIAGLVQGCI